MTIAERNSITNTYIQNVASNIPSRVTNRVQKEFEIILENTIRNKRTP